MSVIAQRLGKVRELRGLFVQLDPAAARAVHDQAWSLRLGPAELVDISGWTTEGGTRALARLGPRGEAEAFITWASSSNDVVSTTWDVFAKHWDDFWYPSSDDVRVLVDRGWIIDIDHEERLGVVARGD